MIVYKFIDGKLTTEEVVEKLGPIIFKKADGSKIYGYSETEKQAIYAEAIRVRNTIYMTSLSTNVSEKEKKNRIEKSLSWLKKHDPKTEKQAKEWIQNHKY